MLQFQKPKNIGSLTSILLVLIKKKECRPKLNNIFVYHCIKPLNTKDYSGALKTAHERY